MANKYFIIDFDSTFTKVEALDELCKISLKGKPQCDSHLQQIEEITLQAMAGSLSFAEALERRVALLEAKKQDLTPLIEALSQRVSESFRRNQDFFAHYADTILIVSSGFREFISPIVKPYGVREENIYANTFLYDEQDNIIGFDKNNVLSQDNGKVQLLKSLALQGDVHVIGDGYTDYQIREAGLANKFYAFTENIKRDNVVQQADYEIPNLDEFLYVNDLKRNISYPKHRIKVLLLENIHPNAQAYFEQEGYKVELLKHGLDEDELCEAIKDVSILGIRSKTQLTARAVASAQRLIGVGAFCIGTNQIDLQAALERGVPVFNAPYSNTRSVVELAIAEMIMLLRNIPRSLRNMDKGKWDKSAAQSYEIRGKKLGIIGYGNIGAQLSVVAESLGIDVYYYDIVDKLAMGNATACTSLEELLRTVDIVSLHVDGRVENECLIGAKEFDLMKEGVVFMNLARGSVVDIEALVSNLNSGKILGAAVDVYPEEPKSNDEPFISALKAIPNVIHTPHIGGSTQEAQYNIAEFVPKKIVEYINSGTTFGSVNFPEIQLPKLQNAHRLIHIHRNVPGILAQINQILAESQANIVGQYLKTNETVGYVITDVDKQYSKHLIEKLKSIEHTMRFRVLY
ncbi:MAG: phosphoglycerate dehydrogenase [Bernardetiaceae bacterium]|nr:phosphoglycerate dehydrogenase [Bernardetiaceae bacterium]